MTNVPAPERPPAVPLGSSALVARYDAAMGGTFTHHQRVNRLKVLRSLAAWVDPVPLSEATADQVAPWLKRLKASTRAEYWRFVREFYAWAKKAKVREDDPAAELRARYRVPARPKADPDTLEQLALRWVRERQDLGALNPTSAIQSRNRLLTFVDACSSTDPAKVNRRDILRWTAAQEGFCENTRYHLWSEVRRFLIRLVEEGHLRRSPMNGLKPPKMVRTVHRALDHEQVSTLLAACEDDRERLIVVLGVHTGLRRAEMADLQVGDVSLSGRSVLVRRGKGGHSRQLPLSEEACSVIGRYLAEYGLSSGPVLRNQTRPGLGIKPATVGLIMTKLAMRSGVKVGPRDGVGTHSLRHTMASDVYATTRDVLVVRDLLGHVNLGTTERYVRGLNLEAMRSAVEGRSYLPGPVGDREYDVPSISDGAR